MRKQCLFDPNHLIDELAYSKHLQNCQSKLKKDWRQCRYEQSHWLLYKYIEFHQSYQCTQSPLYKKDPVQFFQRKNQQIAKRKIEAQRITKKPKQMVFDQSKVDSKISKQLSVDRKQHQQTISFGDISLIKNLKHPIYTDLNISKFDQMNDDSIIQLGNVLSPHQTFKSQFSKEQIDKIKRKQTNQQQVSYKSKEKFIESLPKIKQQLWVQPDFQQFEKKLRKQWNLRNQNQGQIEISEVVSRIYNSSSFYQEQQHQITLGNIQTKYNQLYFN